MAKIKGKQLSDTLRSESNPFNTIYSDRTVGDLNGAVRFTAHNDTGSTIGAYKVVYITGVNGNTPTIGLADADTSSMPAFGLTVASSNDGDDVDVITFGNIKGVDTSLLSVGDVLYVSTTAGEYTTTKPTGSSSKLQNIGMVVKADQNGIIKVGGAGRSAATPNLDEGKFFIGNASDESSQSAYKLPLTAGTSGQVLTSNGTDVIFQDASGGSVTYTALTTGIAEANFEIANYRADESNTSDITIELSTTGFNLSDALALDDQEFIVENLSTSIINLKINSAREYVSNVYYDTYFKHSGDYDVQGIGNSGTLIYTIKPFQSVKVHCEVTSNTSTLKRLVYHVIPTGGVLGSFAYEEITANATIKPNYYYVSYSSSDLTLTLEDRGDIGLGERLEVRNQGSGTLTIDGSGTQTINGSQTFTLSQYNHALIVRGDSEWEAWTSGGTSASTSVAGVIEIATNAEATAASATDKALVPSNLSSIALSSLNDDLSYQPLDAGLTSISGLNTTSDKMIYTTGSDTYSTTTLTGVGRTFLGATTQAIQRSYLGLGTAAVLNTGTSADNVVKLDSQAKLPAVDGSQLTNLPFVPSSIYDAGGSTATTAVKNRRYIFRAISTSTVTVTLPAISTLVDGDCFVFQRTAGGDLVIQDNGSESVAIDFNWNGSNVSGSVTITTVSAQSFTVVYDSANTQFYIFDSVFLTDVVNDTTPQLGGDLDVNGNSIVSTSNGNIEIAPNGSGAIVVSGNNDPGAIRFFDETNTYYTEVRGPQDKDTTANTTFNLPYADGTSGQVLSTDGNGQLGFVTISGGSGDSYTYEAVNSATVTTVTGQTWYHYSVNAASNAVTINLPALNTPTTDGDEIRVKVMDATNTVTIDANSTETIDGNTTLVLNTQYESVTLVAGSTGWEII